MKRLEKYLSSVHPLVKYNFFGKTITFLLYIPPNFSVFYQLNLEYHFYLLFLLNFILYPPLAFFLAYKSRNPKKFELMISQNVEPLIAGIWLPICQFNPLLIFLCVLFIFQESIMGGGNIVKFVIRTMILVCGVIVGGIFFGFNLTSDILPSTLFWSGVMIFSGGAVSSLLFMRSNKIIISTRKKLIEQKAKLDKELEDAADYVKKMLPSPIHDDPIHIDWRFFPSAQLGGDAFGYKWLNENNFAIYLLDVSGHGVNAALLSASVLNVLRSESLLNTDFKEPKQVLKALNTTFPTDDNNDMFFTFWYGVYNFSDRTLIYASAGHPPALLFAKESAATQLMTKNFVIGGMPDMPYQQSKQTIENGACMYVFTDGVYEVELKDGRMWRFNEYMALLSDINSDTPYSLEALYDQTMQICKNDTFEDDYTILRVKFI